MSFHPPGLVKTKADIIRCKDCGASIGGCEHTEGELPDGFEVAVLVMPGVTIPAYLNRPREMPFHCELTEVRPMTQPSGSIFFDSKHGR